MEIKKLPQINKERLDDVQEVINQLTEQLSMISRDILVRNNGEYIQFQQKGDSEWQNVINIADLRGEKGQDGLQGVKGKTGEQGLRGEAGVAGKDGRDGKDGRNGLNRRNGKDGSPIELRKTDTHIQWKRENEKKWRDLIKLEDITGPQGNRGAMGMQGPQGAEGPQGPQGIQGEKGDKGDTGNTGPAGAGLASGGTTGQLASKASDTDYDTEWIDPPTSGIDPDTEENLLSSTPDGSGYVIATDTLRGLYYNADNTQWYITSIPLSTELANPDAGYTQDSDKRGYGDDYIYGKKLYATGIGDFTDTPYEGAIKVDQDFTPAKYQIYLRGKWNTLFYDLTMENGDFEHVPQTYSIDVRSGNSNTTGLNGQPIIREYKVDAGAYPREVIIDCGVLA